MSARKYGPEVKDHVFKVVEILGWAATPKDVDHSWETALAASYPAKPSRTTIKNLCMELVVDGRLVRARGRRFCFLPKGVPDGRFASE